MLAEEGAVCRSDTSPKVKLQIPDDIPHVDVVKALEAITQGLRGEQEAKPLSGIEDQNPAAKHLVKFIEDSYSTMVGSLDKEIGKVLES